MYWPPLNMYWESSGFGRGGGYYGGALMNTGGDYLSICLHISSHLFVYTYIHIYLYIYTYVSPRCCLTPCADSGVQAAT